MGKNKGTEFEGYLVKLFKQYRQQGRARIEKVDPPSRSIGRGRTILLPNPWLDFSGAWTERGGQTLIIEAKHTDKDRLDIDRHGGVTEKQWAEFETWEAAGAACAIVWRYEDSVKVVTLPMARNLTRKRVSMKWCEAPGPLYDTGGNADILSTMAATIPVRPVLAPCPACMGSMIDPEGEWLHENEVSIDFCRQCQGSGRDLTKPPCADCGAMTDKEASEKCLGQEECHGMILWGT